MSKSDTITLPVQSVQDFRNRWPNNSSYSSGLLDTIVWIKGQRFNVAHTTRPGLVNFELVTGTTQDKAQIDQEYAARNQRLKGDLDVQVQQLAGSLNNLIQHEIIERQSSATQQLLNAKSAALPAQQQLAQKFFGQSPLGKSIADVLHVAMTRASPAGIREEWRESYRAAYEAKLLGSAIDHLTMKVHALEVKKRFSARDLKSAQALEKKISEVDLQLAKLELAQHAHQVSSRQLQESLDHFDRHDLETLADQEVALHGKELEDELAALLQTHKTDNLTRYQAQSSVFTLNMRTKDLKYALSSTPPRNIRPGTFANADSLLQKSMQILAEQEQRRPEIQRLARAYSKRITAAMTSANNELARIAALSGSEIPQRPYTYRLPADSTAQVQVITPSAASMSSFVAVGTALGGALQAARPFVGGRNRLVLEVALLLLFSFRLDHGDRYGISSPLKELLPDINPQDVVDRIGKYLDVPIRLISGMIDENSAVQAVGTDAEGVPAGVPVRQATWDAAQGAYSFVTDGPGPITVLWTPQGEPIDSSTTLPAEDQPQRLYPGIISVPSTPTLLTLPSTDDLNFSDYIVTFPADSGLEPVYIMFKSPRDYAGAGVGNGRDISGWEEAIYSASGAPLPTRIADQLRGRIFGRWGKMRAAIWKAIAKDPELSKNFAEVSLDRMRQGGAPYADVGKVGGKKVLELHHIHPIAEGGAVYDLDNLVIMTPRAHIDIHKKGEE